MTQVIVSHLHNFIFIKSEKTAGTSVEAALSSHCGDMDVVTPLGNYFFNRNEKGEWVHKSMNAEGFNQHDSAEAIKTKLPAEVWMTYFKFSIARNPWDRMLSDFFWRRRRDASVNPKKKFYHYLGVPFDGLTQTAKLFGEFIKEGGWTTNDRFYVSEGTLCVDYVIHYERISEDLKEVCKRVGLPQVELPHLKSGMRKRDHHYSEYYEAESRRIVAERHRNDIELLGYGFESSTI